MPAPARSLLDDPRVRALVDAEVARAHVDLHALRVEHERDLAVIDELKRRLKAAQAEIRKLRQDHRYGRTTTDHIEKPIPFGDYSGDGT